MVTDVDGDPPIKSPLIVFRVPFLYMFVIYFCFIEFHFECYGPAIFSRETGKLNLYRDWT